MSNQGQVFKVTIDKVLANHFFTRGVKDFLAGKGFDKDYDNWAYTKSVNAQWQYERGRQFAAATGGKIPTKYGPGNKRVNWRAVDVFADLVNSGAIR
jgi:hypothetical protein